MNAIRTSILCLLPAVWCAVLTLDAFGQDIVAENDADAILGEAQECWRRISNSKPTDPNTDAVATWLEVREQCCREFDKLFDGENDRLQMEYFVSQFGEHGAQADLRWILAEPTSTIAQGGDGHHLTASENGRNDRGIQNLVAEFQVRRFLSDKDLLAHYYEAVLWLGDMERFFPDRFQRTQDGLQEKDESDYWWYARDGILMMHATGCDAMLDGVRPEGVAEAFEKWSEWLGKNGPFLRPSERFIGWEIDEGERERMEGYVPFILRRELPDLKQPKTPFSDWKGTPPPDVELFRRL